MPFHPCVQLRKLEVHSFDLEDTKALSAVLFKLQNLEDLTLASLPRNCEEFKMCVEQSEDVCYDCLQLVIVQQPEFIKQQSLGPICLLPLLAGPHPF